MAPRAPWIKCFFVYALTSQMRARASTPRHARVARCRARVTSSAMSRTHRGASARRAAAPSSPWTPRTSPLGQDARRGTALRASSEASAAASWTPRTLGWGKRRGAIDPVRDADVLERTPGTHGYCVYSHADWSNAYASADGEHDYVCCGDAIEYGTIPDDLAQGTLYRVGPGLFERGGKEYKHMLDGDGLAVRFEFSRGQTMRFQSRFVRTEAFVEEEKEDKVLYRGTFGTMRDGGPLANWFDLRTKNLANTNIIAWGGKVLALYEAGRPVTLDAGTLEANGVDDLDGRLDPGEYFTLGLPEPVGRAIETAANMGGRAFTAHPKIDSHTNFLCGWGWKSRITAKAVEIKLWEWDDDWNERGSREYVMEGCEAAPHDFGVTAKWYVMIQNRLGIDPLPFLAGVKGAGECLISQPEQPLLVHLIPRATNAALEPTQTKPPAPVVATGPLASFEIHTALAHDGPPLRDGDDVSARALDDWVTVYTAGWDALSPGVFLGEWGASAAWPFPIATELTPDFNNIPRTLLWMYQINSKTGEVKREPAPGCDDLCIDHPHVSPLYEGKRECRYVYASLSNEVKVSGPPLGYVRIDLKTGELQKWYASNRSFCEEPVIVPKRDGQSETDAWLIGLVADHRAKHPRGISRLVVLDCAAIDKGPVVSIRLNNRIPHGLHGMFVRSKYTLDFRNCSSS